MHLALTGATGFIGKRVLAALAGHPDSVYALSRRPPPEPGGRVQWVSGGLDSGTALESLVEDAHTVVHIAGAVGGRRPRDFIDTNVTGTRLLTEAIRQHAPGAHLIFVSSLAAREPELSAYAASKRMAEEVVTTRLERFTILRPPAVYGPDDPALAGFWRALARGWLLRAGPAGQRFSLIHVDDLAEAIRRLCLAGPTGTILELHDGRREGWSWPDIATLAARARGGPVRTIALPRGLLRTAAAINCLPLPGRRNAPVLYPGKVRELAHPDWVCDNKTLSTTLNWSPQARLDERLATLPGWNSQT